LALASCKQIKNARKYKGFYSSDVFSASYQQVRKEEDMLEELRCTHCDAPLNPKTLKCEYCGSQYERKQEAGMTHYIQTCPAQIQTIASEIRVSRECMTNIPEPIIADKATMRLTRNLAEVLADYMKVETRMDWETNTQIIRGTVRVVEPDFRF
jgi:predicted amidophosphoribosyltransferase